MNDFNKNQLAKSVSLLLKFSAVGSDTPNWCLLELVS